MAKYTTSDGVRGILGEDGVGWTKNDQGRWVTDYCGVRYELEKRRRYPGDTPSTGWYLFSSGAADGDFVGEWCGRRLLDAVDEANREIARFDLRP